MRIYKTMLVGAMVTAWTGTAQAQVEEVAPEDLRKEAMTKTATTIPDGWRITAKIGGGLNVTDARNVVGATEGTAIQISFKLDAEARYKKGQHTLDNILSIIETITQTPTADGEAGPFVKSQDVLDFVSTYVYRFSDPGWLGPFAQFKLNTQIFPTNTEPTNDFRIRRLGATEPDGTQFFLARESFEQNGAFEPLLLRQTGGLFAEPFSEDVFTIDFKVGIGAQETIARDGFTLVEVVTEPIDPANPDGPTVDVYVLQQYETIVDLGLEATAKAKGYILKDVLTWNAAVVAFLPAISSTEVFDDSGRELDSLERLNLEITGGLALKLTKYVSVDYSLLVRRFPQIRNDFQVQNNFLLTLTVDVL